MGVSNACLGGGEGARVDELQLAFFTESGAIRAADLGKTPVVAGEDKSCEVRVLEYATMLPIALRTGASFAALGAGGGIFSVVRGPVGTTKPSATTKLANLVARDSRAPHCASKTRCCSSLQVFAIKSAARECCCCTMIDDESWDRIWTKH